MENETPKCNHVSRVGLYIFVFITMVSSCVAETVINRIEKKIDKLEKRIELIITQNNPPPHLTEYRK